MTELDSEYIDALFRDSEADLDDFRKQAIDAGDVPDCRCAMTDCVKRFSTDELKLIRRFLAIGFGIEHDAIHGFLELPNPDKDKTLEYELACAVVGWCAGTTDHINTELDRRNTEFDLPA